jgi:two-component system, NtrC family, sensor kinase
MLQTSEAEESLRFLAKIGPQITSTLSFPEAAENICRAIMPHFAADCIVFLKRDPFNASPFWSKDLSSNCELRQSMESLAESDAAITVHNRLIIAPLRVGGSGMGAIAFCLDADREYTSPDQALAGDLASRAALSLQNCILFASEQATRSALIQAEKLATAGRLSAAIAHEINNPLEALTNLIYIIEQSPEASDLIRESASAALAELTRLAHITRQSLGFYREPSTPSLLDMSQILEDTLELYKRRLDSKRIRVEMALRGKVEIKGSAGEIRQVISNLVVNALESMDMDGSIQLAAFVRERAAVLSVSDTGPGIDPVTLPQIFDAFYTTKQGTGTGLGLWIVKKIVEKHGGKISVSSTIAPPTHGTTFEVEFPLAHP